MTREQEMAVLSQAVEIHDAARSIAHQRADECRNELCQVRGENIQLRLRVAELEREMRFGISAD